MKFICNSRGSDRIELINKHNELIMIFSRYHNDQTQIRVFNIADLDNDIGAEWKENNHYWPKKSDLKNVISLKYNEKYIL